MKKPLVQTQLERLDTPDIEMSLHQQQLKAVLLSAHARGTSRSDFLGTLRHYYNYFTHMPTVKKLVLPSGVLVAIALVAVIGFSFVSNSPRAYAQQVAQQGLNMVSQANLPSSEVAAIAKQFGSFQNAQTELENAKNAGDLAVLTYTEFAAQSQTSSTAGYGQIAADVAPGSVASSDPQMAAQLQNGKFLEFTDTNGDKTVIGIDHNNAPLMFVHSNGNNTTVTPMRLPSTQ